MNTGSRPIASEEDDMEDVENQGLGASLREQALAVPVEPASGLAPSGFDPSRVTYAISSSACFFPEEDEPVRFDGLTITWTFEALKTAECGAGLYRIEFVRALTREERNAKSGALLASAIEARSGETRQGLDPEGTKARAEGDAQTPSGDPQ
jgi:hypothetical protein